MKMLQALLLTHVKRKHLTPGPTVGFIKKKVFESSNQALSFGNF